MLGTPDGYWYSMSVCPNGLIDYEFFQGNERLQDGVCTEAEMFARFDALLAASSKRKRPRAVSRAGPVG